MENIIDRVIRIRGCLNQVDQTQEECGELITAINKLKRRGFVSKESIKKPDSNTSFKARMDYFNACAEVADVIIMTEQLLKMLDGEIIQLYKERKLSRLAKKLDRGED